MFSSKIERGFHKLYIDNQFVGKISNDESTLYYTPKLIGNSFWLSRDILFAKTLDYFYISIVYKGSEYMTTRAFWQRVTLKNEREGALVPLHRNKFNLMEAIISDVDESQQRQLDIFDVGERESLEGDSKIKKIFLKSVERKDENTTESR